MEHWQLGNQAQQAGDNIGKEVGWFIFGVETRQ